MRKLYKEFFYISKHEKIREKVMLTRVATTIAIMVFCLAAMGITAYAYFSYNVTSDSNIIKAASFYTDVTVQITDADGKAVEVITSNYKSHVAELKANTKYYITLQHTDRSTVKTGFVIITAENCNSRYHTQQLGKDGDGNTETITFWLQPNADTKVTFFSHWGTSSYYGYPTENNVFYVLNGEEVTLSIIGATNKNSSTNNNDSTGEETETAPTTESTITSSTETTVTSEQPDTTEPSTSATEPTATQPAETSATETTGTDSTEQTQPTTENTETTGAPTTEASE